MKNKSLYIFIAAFFMLPFFAAFPAHANISLNASVINIKKADRPVKNILVTNTGKEPIKVQVKTVKMFKPGLEDEKEEPTRDIVVAPGGFELAAGETRTVRVVLKDKPEDNESVYRVRFIPQKATMTVEQKHSQKITTRVNVLVGMGVLVLVEPQNPSPNLVATHNGKTITYKNNGNVTREVVRTKNCANEECAKLEGRRLYPGMEWTQPLPEFMNNQPVTVTLKTSGEFSNLEVAAP